MIGQALFVLFAFAIAVVVFAPTTEVGKAFRRALVIAPARFLSGGPMKMFVAIVVFAALVAFAVGAPELVDLVGMADLSLYLDMAILSFILGAVTGFRSAARSVILGVRRVLSGRHFDRAHVGQTRARTPRSSKPGRSLSDDEEWPSNAWALA